MGNVPRIKLGHCQTTITLPNNSLSLSPSLPLPPSPSQAGMKFMVLNILYFWYFRRVTLFNQGVVVRLAWKFSEVRETVFTLWQDVIS